MVKWWIGVFVGKTIYILECYALGGGRSHLQQGVCRIVALPFTLKSVLMQKNKLWKLKYFTMQKYANLQKNPLKETKILQDIITLL